MSHTKHSVPTSMAHKSNPFFAVFSVSLIIILLAVSIYNAGSCMYRTTGDGWQRYAMNATVFGLLASSHCLAHMVGQGIKRGLFIVTALCALTILPIELFSVATSSAALNSRVHDSVRRENQSSPEYLAAMRTVNNYKAQMDSLRESAANLPVTFVTKRESLHTKIEQLQVKQDRAQVHANTIDVSTTAAVYSSLQSVTGLSSSMIGNIAAMLLSGVPIVFGIGFAALSRRRDVSVKASPVVRKKPSQASKVQPAKKAKRHLQTV